MNSTVKYYGREYNVFTIRAFGMTYPVIVVERQYGNGSLALEALTLDRDGDIGDSFGVITVNIPGQSNSKLCAFVKNYSENAGWAEKLAEKIGGKKTQESATTGFVTVPFYDFSNMKIYAGED